MKIRTGAETWLVRKTSDGQFETLLLRKISAIHPPFWQPPTGGSEPGESNYETSVREVREETGLEIHENRLVLLREKQEIRLEKLEMMWHASVFFVFGEFNSETILISEEHDQFGWFSLDSAGEKLTWPGNIENLEMLKIALETH